MVIRYCILCLVYIVVVLIRLGEGNGGLYKEIGFVFSWGDIFNVFIKKNNFNIKCFGKYYFDIYYLIFIILINYIIENIVNKKR